MTHSSDHKMLKLRKMLGLGLTLQPCSGKTTCDDNGSVVKTVAVDDYDRYLGSVDTSDGMA